MAHATDGGGSIRVPASACGLFGMKPTRARTPSGPDVGEGWGAQAVYHCVSRSVRDSAALLDATHGPEPGDPYWAPPPSGPFLAEVGRAPPALRIALCVESWNGQPVDPDCRQAAEDAAKLCETLGHIVSIACPEADFAALRVAQRTIVAAHIQATLRWRAAALGKIPSPEDMEPYTWVVSELADRYTAADYAAAITVLHRAGRAVARFFGGHDILITPTMCSPPVPLGVMSSLNTDNESYLTAVNRAIGFTALFNASGNPAMTLPLHWTASGLPVGVQFVAPFGDEATLFRLAGQIEIACPWKDRRPSLAA
jgi:amidase/6-aminohexanoate-cyclic-dimer hydrolase